MPYKHKSVRSKYLKQCRKKHAKRLREYDKQRWRNDPRRKSFQRKYYADNPEKQMETQRAIRYGVSPEEYKARVKKQKNRCAVCRRKERRINYRTGRVQSLSIDHNHKTKKNRELLCQDCNFAIGLFKEDVSILVMAIKYLRKHNGRRNERINIQVALHAHRV